MSDFLMHDKVSKLYQKYPYPKYPIFAGIRWAEAHHSSAHFAAALRRGSSKIKCQNNSIQHVTPSSTDILIVGCGDTMPYIIRNIEPSQHNIHALDISKRSINRAKIRLWRTPGRVNFINSDFIEFAQTTKLQFDHIDCYGVIHHMANPTQAIKLLSKILKPQATLRLMVYNSKARNWIHQLSRSFKLLGLNAYNKADIIHAIDILKSLANSNPIMYDRLYNSGILRNIHIPRIVDTFFHPREARINLKSYFDALEYNGLKINGLWDRYAELDDLENPLWQVPSISALSERSEDLRFENNLEIFCHKIGMTGSIPAPFHTNQNHVSRLLSKSPPSHWFDFTETKNIPWHKRRLIWTAYISALYQNKLVCLDSLLLSMPRETRQRLARVGAIIPTQDISSKLRSEMLHPIHDSMESNYDSMRKNIISASLHEKISRITKEKDRPKKSLDIVLQRLIQAGL